MLELTAAEWQHECLSSPVAAVEEAAEAHFDCILIEMCLNLLNLNIQRKLSRTATSV